MAVVEKAVTSGWALCLQPTDANALGSLRLIPGIEVAQENQILWVRGPQAEESLQAKLSALPAQQRYEWLLPDTLRLKDQRIPSRQLPKLSWQPLSTWLSVEMPAAAFPGARPKPVSLRLVRCADEQSPDLLLTSLDDLIEFAANAAKVRLDRLQFAVNAQGHVLVRGQPLPALPGQRFVLHQGVAVPAGYSWEPAVGTDVLIRCFGVLECALAVWNEDGTLVRLHKEQFVPLTRSALHATKTALQELA
jgi:hypothetical protein